jgi:6-phosphogluconolactonase
MNRLLAQPPYLDDIAWQRVHLFWVDERMVPHDDPASNYGAAEEDFVAEVPIPGEQVHPMPVELPPAEAVANYTRRLKAHFGPQEPAFDLIFLGIGTDGHTASLFPDQAELHTGPQWVLSVKGGNPDVQRLTLNYPVLDRALATVVLVSGENKAEMVQTLLCGRPRQYPPQRIRPRNGKLTWLLDRPAASQLPRQLLEG